jgi:hypothetical protein
VNAKRKAVSKKVAKDVTLTGPQKMEAVQEQFAAPFQALRDQHFASDEYKGLQQFLDCNQDHNHQLQDEFNFFLAATVADQSEGPFPLSEHKWLTQLRSDKYTSLPLNPVEYLSEFPFAMYMSWLTFALFAFFV